MKTIYFIGIILICLLFTSIGYGIGITQQNKLCNAGLEYISDTWLEITTKVMDINATTVAMECEVEKELLRKQIKGENVKKDN